MPKRNDDKLTKESDKNSKKATTARSKSKNVSKSGKCNSDSNVSKPTVVKDAAKKAVKRKIDFDKEQDVDSNNNANQSGTKNC